MQTTPALFSRVLRRGNDHGASPPQPPGPDAYWRRFTVALAVVCAGVTMMVFSAIACGAPRSGWHSDVAFLIGWSVVLAGDLAAPRRRAVR
jgi:hypothetical protein